MLPTEPFDSVVDAVSTMTWRDRLEVVVLMGFPPLLAPILVSYAVWYEVRHPALPTAIVLATAGFLVWRARNLDILIADGVITVANLFWTHRVLTADVSDLRAAASFGGKTIAFLALGRRRGWRIVVHASYSRDRDRRLVCRQKLEAIAGPTDARRVLDYIG